MYHIYARVSGAEQARDDAVSIPEQIRKGRATAQLHGASKFDVVEWIDAGVSGTIPLIERPNGRKMWESADMGDIVVAAKLDRLFRSSSDALNMLGEFRDNKIGVILIDMGTTPVEDSPVSKLFFTMLAAIADFEREVINQRCRDGLIGKRNRGGAVGGTAPYGFDKVGIGQNSMFVANAQEMEVVNFIMRRWERKRTQTEILVSLNKEGYLNRAGKPFDYYQIGRIHKYHSERSKWAIVQPQSNSTTKVSPPREIPAAQ